jgi:Zn-dependent protease
MIDIEILSIVVFLVILFVSVALHEMMHAFIALKLGDDLAHAHGRISLNPIKHIDPFLTLLLPTVMVLLGLAPILAAKPVPVNTSRIKGEELGLAAVGISGPLTNLLLATIGALVLNLSTFGGIMFDIVELFVQLNVALFAFNMLPIPPLDGSRVLYAVAPRPVQQVMEQIEQFGILFVVILITVLAPVISPILLTINEAILGILIR